MREGAVVAGFSSCPSPRPPRFVGLKSTTTRRLGKPTPPGSEISLLGWVVDGSTATNCQVEVVGAAARRFLVGVSSWSGSTIGVSLVSEAVLIENLWKDMMDLLNVTIAGIVCMGIVTARTMAFIHHHKECVRQHNSHCDCSAKLNVSSSHSM